jgi:tetratricopeptide (TPR) repeat protein
VEEFRTLTQIAPGLAEGFSYLGAALSSAEKYGEAEQAMRQSLRLQSTRGALNNLGALLRISGREQEAAPVFEQALRVGADDAGLRLNLGNALRRLGRPDEARKHFERANELSRAALQSNPRDAAARARLSYGMVRLGMTAMAADEALQAARLSPTDYSVLLWTVMTLDASGRREDALPLLSEARYERLRDLMRQPELAQFVRDPRFVMLLQQAQKSQTNPKRSSEDLVRTY